MGSQPTSSADADGTTQDRLKMIRCEACKVYDLDTFQVSLLILLVLIYICWVCLYV